MRRFVIAALAVVAFALPARAADVFQISSPAFKDGDVLPATYMYQGIGIDKTPCGGQGISPPLAWTGAPEGTQSFAVAILDPDGFNGLGVSHWLMYNIPPTVTAVPQGAGSDAVPLYTQGTHQYGLTGFRGFCPPHGSSLHHYDMMVYALDLPPTLPAGLDRAHFLDTINHHVLRASSIVGRVGR
ncbi:MAG: YbhB/YbcL family Raf kinase inhibitor-like protein [Candidatus Velthaea sp.]|jgi:Raf kinase inhibitor-like YbhB/YbcL family protein